MRRVVQTQRTATLRHLQDLTRLKKHVGDQATDGAGGADIAWLLVLENLVFSAEAEVRWLDHVEAMLARKASEPRRHMTGAPTTSDDITLGRATR